MDLVHMPPVPFSRNPCQLRAESRGHSALRVLWTIYHTQGGDTYSCSLDLAQEHILLGPHCRDWQSTHYQVLSGRLQGCPYQWKDIYQSRLPRAYPLQEQLWKSPFP